MIIKQICLTDGKIKDIEIFFKGSGNPQFDHEIIGITINYENSYYDKKIGDCSHYDETDIYDHIWEK